MTQAKNSPTRRTFLSAGAIATAATILPTSVHAAGSDVLKIGIVGTGGRGKGAIRDIMIADKNAKLVAMCDIFPDFLESAHASVSKQFKDRVDVPKERMYTGFDGYKQLIDNSGCDIVFLTTPPGFRPQQLAYAVEKGKHVFAEKPMAVDAPGVRSVIESARKAKEKNLMCASGYCFRYEHAKRETVKRIHDGMIGDVVNIQATYNTGPIWYRDVGADWDEMKVQVRNWYYYSWLSGDFIVEQHCHNLDKAMWVMKDELPIAATGLGGRQVRTDAKFGNIYDHFSTIFEYADGKRLFSYCRQMPKCHGEVSDIVFGTKGVAKLMPHTISPKGGALWAYDGPATDMYVEEHKDFVAALKAGKPINDMENAAKSSLMGILGREACYSGQRILYKDMLASNVTLAPSKLEWGSSPVQGVPFARVPMTPLNRRDFLTTTVGLTAAALATPVQAADKKAKLKIAVKYSMIGIKGTEQEKLELVKKIGFHGVEIDSPSGINLDNLVKARDATGIAIHGVIDSVHWRDTLSSPDEKVREKGRKALEGALNDAKKVGADTVLLVPGVVNKDATYEQCYERSQAEVKKVLPLAEKLNVKIAIETVWNNFITKPEQLISYVDDFKSEWVAAYFDCSNMIKYGVAPADWIRKLGKRMVKFDFKAYSNAKQWNVKIGEGDENWPEVLKALGEIGYDGWATSEVGAGGEEHLKDIAARMNKVLGLG